MPTDIRDTPLWFLHGFSTMETNKEKKDHDSYTSSPGSSLRESTSQTTGALFYAGDMLLRYHANHSYANKRDRQTAYHEAKTSEWTTLAPDIQQMAHLTYETIWQTPSSYLHHTTHVYDRYEYRYKQNGTDEVHKELSQDRRHDCKPHETYADKWKRCSSYNHDYEDVFQILLTTPDSLLQRWSPLSHNKQWWHSDCYDKRVQYRSFPPPVAPWLLAS